MAIVREAVVAAFLAIITLLKGMVPGDVIIVVAILRVAAMQPKNGRMIPPLPMAINVALLNWTLEKNGETKRKSKQQCMFVRPGNLFFQIKQSAHRRAHL